MRVEQQGGTWVCVDDSGVVCRAAHKHEIPAGEITELTPTFAVDHGERLERRYQWHLEKARAVKAILDELGRSVDLVEEQLTESEEERILIDLRDGFTEIRSELRDLKNKIQPSAAIPDLIGPLSEFRAAQDGRFAQLISQVAVSRVAPTDISPLVAELESMRAANAEMFKKIEELTAPRLSWWARFVGWFK